MIETLSRAVVAAFTGRYWEGPWSVRGALGRDRSSSGIEVDPVVEAVHQKPAAVLHERDQGTLARLDRRLLARLGRDERFQMVRVPVTPAFWATWKRYCDTAGVSMGRAIAALIDQALATVLDDSKGAVPSVFEEQVQQRLADRAAALTKRERELGAAEERMRRWSEHLREQEREIEARERRGGSDEVVG